MDYHHSHKVPGGWSLRLAIAWPWNSSIPQYVQHEFENNGEIELSREEREEMDFESSSDALGDCMHGPRPSPALPLSSLAAASPPLAGSTTTSPGSPPPPSPPTRVVWADLTEEAHRVVGCAIVVIFADIISRHGYCMHSVEIILALNKLVVDISKPKLDPKADAVFDTSWILITGLPDIARSEWVIRNMSRILNKVIVVDELSLRNEEEVRVNVKSLDSSKLRATIRVFFNNLGFNLKIALEPPNHVGRPRFSDDGNFGGGLGGANDYHG